jgi:hypothetical protein
MVERDRPTQQETDTNPTLVACRWAAARIEGFKNKYGRTLVPATCATCGSTVFRQPSVLRRYADAYCSRACFSAGQRGEKNRTWRGDTATRSAGQFRAQALYPNRPCDRCGAPPDALWRMERHHRDGNRLNNNQANVEVLCIPCHKQTHRDLTIHCRRGHLFDAVTTRFGADGRRRCRLCQAEALRRRRASRKEVAR